MDWDNLITRPVRDQRPHLGLNGRNKAFFLEIAQHLQLDFKRPVTFQSLKGKFTPQVVHDLHQAVVDLWPNADDYDRCMAAEPDGVSALYTGNYDPESVFKAITRHSLYSERIYVFDPFLYGPAISNQYSPILHPEEHQANTIQAAYLWCCLVPWIRAGIVSMIRPPSDFVPGLKLKTIDIGRERFEKHAELKAMLDKQVSATLDKSRLDRGWSEYLLLSMPDEFWLKDIGTYPGTKEEMLEFLRQRREEHPYWIPPRPGSTILQQSTGANYELSKITCGVTKSHLITDLPTRWKEAEIDRKEGGREEDAWTPFAKALQGCSLKILDDITMDRALRLRSENRLESMRHFFNRVWRSCRDSDDFSQVNTTNLAAELDDKIKEADAEWKKINDDLLKWGGGASTVAAIASTVGFLPAAPITALSAAAAGAIALTRSTLQRASLKDQQPAGFFLGR